MFFYFYKKLIFFHYTREGKRKKREREKSMSNLRRMINWFNYESAFKSYQDNGDGTWTLTGVRPIQGNYLVMDGMTERLVNALYPISFSLLIIFYVWFINR